MLLDVLMARWVMSSNLSRCLGGRFFIEAELTHTPLDLLESSSMKTFAQILYRHLMRSFLARRKTAKHQPQNKVAAGLQKGFECCCRLFGVCGLKLIY